MYPFLETNASNDQTILTLKNSLSTHFIDLTLKLKFIFSYTVHLTLYFLDSLNFFQDTGSANLIRGPTFKTFRGQNARLSQVPLTILLQYQSGHF